MYLEITFTEGHYTRSRILKTDKELTEKQVKVYYQEFCKANKMWINYVTPWGDEILQWVKRENVPVDIYSINRMYSYNAKATEYAEKYGIITYKLQNNYMIFYQNYYNKECLGGKWVNKPCTYKRIVDLDTLNVESVQLKRLQKSGWDNI